MENILLIALLCAFLWLALIIKAALTDYEKIKEEHFSENER